MLPSVAGRETMDRKVLLRAGEADHQNARAEKQDQPKQASFCGTRSSGRSIRIRFVPILRRLSERFVEECSCR